ncbi:hypothetical protein ACHQM5_002503 [Ranunculus cassubicifolius]
MGTWPPCSKGKENEPAVATYIPVQAPPPPHICTTPHETYFPWIVPLIFIADVAAFIYTMYVNNCPASSNECVFPELGRYAFQPLTENMFLGPTADTLQKVGALQVSLVVVDGQVWRLITCIWLHAGVVHLVLNMISLLFVGVRLEKEFGFWKIGLLYVLSGFGGSLASCNQLKLSSKQGASLIKSVGASGALFGLLGAMLSELIMNWTIYANKCIALVTLIFIIALNMAIGFIPGVDISAHVGGFSAGFLLGFILLIRPQFGWVSRKHIPPGYDLRRLKPKHKCYQYLLWVLAFVMLVVGFAFSVATLFKGNVQNSSVPS